MERMEGDLLMLIQEEQYQRLSERLTKFIIYQVKLSLRLTCFFFSFFLIVTSGSYVYKGCCCSKILA